MKFILYLAVIIIIIPLAGKYPGLAEFDQEDPLTDKIPGIWDVSRFETFYTSDSTLTSLHCNSCPQVTFNSDKTGCINLPSGKKQEFNWQADNTKMIITNRSLDNEKKLLPDQKYQLSFNKETDFIEMNLCLEAEEYSYTTVLLKHN